MQTVFVIAAGTIALFLGASGLESDVLQGGVCAAGAPQIEHDPVEDAAMVQMPRPNIQSGEPEVSLSSLPRLATGGKRKSLPSSDEQVEPCSIVTYPAKLALPSNALAAGFEPPMVVGDESNMDPRLKDLGLDFTGIWWMRGNPVPEELISFASSTVNSSTYPVRLSVPGNRKGHWSWVNDAIGRLLVKYYTVYDANGGISFDFRNGTHGDKQTTLKELPLVWVEAWPLIYLNDDEWLRVNIFGEGSLLNNQNYTLTRVIQSDGTPHPTFWPLFMEHMSSRPWWGGGAPGELEMISFHSDNECMRKCQTLMPCLVCTEMCDKNNMTHIPNVSNIPGVICEALKIPDCDLLVR